MTAITLSRFNIWHFDVLDASQERNSFCQSVPSAYACIQARKAQGTVTGPVVEHELSPAIGGIVSLPA